MLSLSAARVLYVSLLVNIRQGKPHASFFNILIASYILILYDLIYFGSSSWSYVIVRRDFKRWCLMRSPKTKKKDLSTLLCLMTIHTPFPSIENWTIVLQIILVTFLVYALLSVFSLFCLVAFLLVVSFEQQYIFVVILV